MLAAGGRAGGGMGRSLLPSMSQVLAGFFQSVLIQETFLDCVFDDSSIILFPLSEALVIMII